MAKSVDVVHYAFLEKIPVFTPLEALAEAARRRRDKDTKCKHKPTMVGECAHMTACVYGFRAYGHGKAIELWEALDPKFRREGLDRMMSAPAGALCFWKGGSKKNGFPGHIAISNGKGKVFGTDLPTPGLYGLHPTDRVAPDFGTVKPVGWAFPLFLNAPADTRKPPPVPKPLPPLPSLIEQIVTAHDELLQLTSSALRSGPQPEDAAQLKKLRSASRRQGRAAARLQ